MVVKSSANMASCAAQQLRLKATPATFRCNDCMLVSSALVEPLRRRGLVLPTCFFFLLAFLSVRIKGPSSVDGSTSSQMYQDVLITAIQSVICFALILLVAHSVNRHIFVRSINSFEACAIVVNVMFGDLISLGDAYDEGRIMCSMIRLSLVTLPWSLVIASIDSWDTDRKRKALAAFAVLLWTVAGWAIEGYFDAHWHKRESCLWVDDCFGYPGFWGAFLATRVHLAMLVSKALVSYAICGHEFATLRPHYAVMTTDEEAREQIMSKSPEGRKLGSPNFAMSPDLDSLSMIAECEFVDIAAEKRLNWAVHDEAPIQGLVTTWEFQDGQSLPGPVAGAASSVIGSPIQQNSASWERLLQASSPPSVGVGNSPQPFSAKGSPVRPRDPGCKASVQNTATQLTMLREPTTLADKATIVLCTDIPSEEVNVVRPSIQAAVPEQGCTSLRQVEPRRTVTGLFASLTSIRQDSPLASPNMASEFGSGANTCESTHKQEATFAVVGTNSDMGPGKFEGVTAMNLAHLFDSVTAQSSLQAAQGDLGEEYCQETEYTVRVDSRQTSAEQELQTSSAVAVAGPQPYFRTPSRNMVCIEGELATEPCVQASPPVAGIGNGTGIGATASPGAKLGLEMTLQASPSMQGPQQLNLPSPKSTNMCSSGASSALDSKTNDGLVMCAERLPHPVRSATRQTVRESPALRQPAHSPARSPTADPLLMQMKMWKSPRSSPVKEVPSLMQMKMWKSPRSSPLKEVPSLMQMKMWKSHSRSPVKMRLKVDADSLVFSVSGRSKMEDQLARFSE